MFEIWSIFGYHHASSSRGRFIDVWVHFSSGFRWPGLHIWWLVIWCHLIFRSTTHLVPYWGIFLSRLRVIDLHGVTWSLPLTGCTPRREHVRYSIIIPQWSLSWATQSSCSAFVCHHASYSGRRFLDIWVRFGLRRSHIWWWMISCHLISDLPYIYAILGHISVSVESYRSSWSYMITPIYEMHTKTRTCSLFYHYPSVEPLLSHQVIIFDICMPSCFLFRETFPWHLGSFWVMEITHLMMDDFMSPDFWSTIHLCHTGAYFCFGWEL